MQPTLIASTFPEYLFRSLIMQFIQVHDCPHNFIFHGLNAENIVELFVGIACMHAMKHNIEQIQ